MMEVSMSLFVFILILAFATIFGIVSIQARRMALLGLSPWSIVPTFLARKLSAAGYAWSCVIPGWILVIIAGLFYNSSTKDPSGPFWCAIYLVILTLGYSALWLLNRHLELKP